MNTDTQTETIRDIIAELRVNVRETCGPEDWEPEQVEEYCRSVAARLERAIELPKGCWTVYGDMIKGKRIPDIINDLRRMGDYFANHGAEKGGRYGDGLSDCNEAQSCWVLADRLEAALAREAAPAGSYDKEAI